MKKVFQGVMITMLLCSVALAADTASKVKPSSTSAVATPMVTGVEGTIAAVDLRANTLKLTMIPGKTMDFVLTGAEVMSAGKKGVLADLKVGQKVKVRRVGSAVKSIEIVPAAK